MYIPQDGEPLPREQTLLLLRELFLIACEPGTLGGMTVGPSPLDPLFMVVHPIFEKALHVLMLSPTYADKYDFTWEETECGDGVSGSALDDTLPFTGILDCCCRGREVLGLRGCCSFRRR